MKDYYEILEVDRNASQEVIEKAYRTLVKRYHPDLKKGSMIDNYDEKIKEINEAYSILSNDYKKTEYDNHLQEKNVSMDKYEKVLNENKILKKKMERIEEIEQDEEEPTSLLGYYKNRAKKLINKAQDNINTKRVQKPRKKLTNEQIRKIIIITVATIIIFVLIAQIPPVKKFLSYLYGKSIIIKSLVDAFISTFKTGF